VRLFAPSGGTAGKVANWRYAWEPQAVAPRIDRTRGGSGKELVGVQVRALDTNATAITEW